MQHIPNTKQHTSDFVSFNPQDQGNPYLQQGGPILAQGDGSRRSVQEIFVVDLTKINGSFGISLTVH